MSEVFIDIMCPQMENGVTRIINCFEKQSFTADIANLC
jgi:hypothetical protein